MRLLDLALQPLTLSLNRLLSLDPESAERMKDLDGRTVAIHLTAPELRIHVGFQASTVTLAQAPAEQTATPDAAIAGTPGALLALARDPERGGTDVAFSGDLGLVRDLRTLLARLDPDLEEPLAQLLGDMPAHKLGNAARDLTDWLTKTRQAAEAGLAEYLTEERRELPTAVETEQFLTDVDRLREDADRLDARLRQLERRVRDTRDRP